MSITDYMCLYLSGENLQLSKHFAALGAYIDMCPYRAIFFLTEFPIVESADQGWVIKQT